MNLEEIQSIVGPTSKPAKLAAGKMCVTPMFGSYLSKDAAVALVKKLHDELSGCEIYAGHIVKWDDMDFYRVYIVIG